MATPTNIHPISVHTKNSCTLEIKESMYIQSPYQMVFESPQDEHLAMA